MSFPESPGPGWIRNSGKLPECERAHVWLRCDRAPFDVTITRPDCKPGWAVKDARWSLTGSDFDIAWYMPI